MARNLVAGGNIVIIKKSGEDGSKYPVAAGSITIGRGAECDFKILRKDVAIVQCTISIYKNFATITNCSDEFPTLVNNESIDSKVLKHGDLLTISNRSFRWEYTHPNAVRTKIPMKATSSGAKKMPFYSASVPSKRKSVNTTYRNLPKRVDPQIQRLVESKGRFSLNELPSGILKLRGRHSVGAGGAGSSQENKVRQVAVVMPQRRSVNAASAANGKAADAVPVTLPTEASPRAADRSSSAHHPRFVTRPHRGKSLSPPKSLSAKGKQKRASMPSAARAAKAKSPTVGRSTPKRAASLVQQPVVVGTSGKPKVEKVIEPDTIDEHKKAALMLLTGRSPVKKQPAAAGPGVTRATPKLSTSIRAKGYVDTPRPKNVPSLPASSKRTPGLARRTPLPASSAERAPSATPLPPSAKRAPSVATASARKSPKRGLFQTPAPKAGSALRRTTRMTPASTAKKTLPKSASKLLANRSSTFIIETPSSSNRSVSSVGLKSAMKSPESKRRSDRIKFDLSNLEEDLVPASPALKTPVPQKSAHSTPHPNTGHRVVYSRRKVSDGSLPLFNLSDSELDLESVSDIEPIEMVNNEDRLNSTFSIRASTNSSHYDTADSVFTSSFSKRQSTSTSGTPAKRLKLSTTSKRVSKTPRLAVVNDVSLNTPEKSLHKTTPAKKSPKKSGNKSPKLSLGELFNWNFNTPAADAVSTSKWQSFKGSASKNRSIGKSASKSQSPEGSTSKSLSTSNSRLSRSAVKSPKHTLTSPKRQLPKGSASKNRSIGKSASKSQSPKGSTLKSHSTSSSRLSRSAVESPQHTLTSPKGQSSKGSASKNRSVRKSALMSQSAEGSTLRSRSTSNSRLSQSAVESPKHTLTTPKRQSLKGSTSKNQSIEKSASKSRSAEGSTSKSRLSLSAIESPKTVSKRQSPKGFASENQSVRKSASMSQSAEGSTSKSRSSSNSQLSLSAVGSPKHTLTSPKWQSPKGSASKNQSMGKSTSKSQSAEGSSLKSLYTSSSRLSRSAVESPKYTPTTPKQQSPKGSASKNQSIGKSASKSQSAGGSASKSLSTSSSWLSLSALESPKGSASKNRSIGKSASKRQSADGSISKNLSTLNSRSSRSSVKTPKLTLTIVHSRMHNSTIEISDTSGTEDGITTPSISILFEPKSSTPKPNKRTSIRDAIEQFQLLTTPEQMHSAKKSGRKTIGAIGHLQKRKSNNLFSQSERKNHSFKAIGLRRTRGSENLHVSSSDASTSSNVTDTNAPKPRLDADENITPKSTLKLKPEQVKEKHSTAKKNRVSRKSFIDHMNDSTDDAVRNLFTIPVKRKLSQSIGHFDTSDIADDSLVSVNFTGVELLQTSRRSEDAADDDDVRYSLPPAVDVQSMSPKSEDEPRYSLPPTTPASARKTVKVKSVNPNREEDEPRYSLPPTTPVRKLQSPKAVPEEDDSRYMLPAEADEDAALEPEANSVESDEPRFSLPPESPKKAEKSPRNNLTDVSGIERLLRTPARTPKNDLTKFTSVKKSSKTPVKSVSLESAESVEPRYRLPHESPKKTAQKSPRNDLTDVSGVKRLLKTPGRPPKNDLTNVAGVKRLLQTPGRKAKSPKNDLTNVAGVKKLLKTPGKSQISPKNDLTNVAGVKKLLETPGRPPKSPRNDLTNVAGVKQLMKSPDRPQKSPRNDLRNASGLKRLFKSPAAPQKSPRNDLSDVRGVRALLKTPKARAGRGDATHASIGNLFDSQNSNSLFDSLLDKPTLRTYSRNTTMVIQTSHNSSAVTVGEKRKSGDVQPTSPNKSPKKPKLSGTPKKPSELNNLFIDMNVESSGGRRRSKNESLQDNSLPIKKRILMRTNNLIGHSTPLRNETPDETTMEQSRLLSPIAFPEKYALQTEATAKSRTAKAKRGAVAEAAPAGRRSRGRNAAAAAAAPRSPKLNPKAERSKQQTKVSPKKVTFSEDVVVSNVETEKTIEKPKPRGRRAAKQEVVISPKAKPAKTRPRATQSKAESPRAEEPAPKSRRRGKAASPQQAPKEKPARTGRGKKTAQAATSLKADDKPTKVKAIPSPVKPAAKGKAKAAAAKPASPKPARTLRGRTAATVEADLPKSPKAATSRSKKATKAVLQVSKKTPSHVANKPTRSRSKAAAPVESPKAPVAKPTRGRKKAEEKATKSPPARTAIPSPVKPAAKGKAKAAAAKPASPKPARTLRGRTAATVEADLPKSPKAATSRSKKATKAVLQVSKKTPSHVANKPTRSRSKAAAPVESPKAPVAKPTRGRKKAEEKATKSPPARTVVTEKSSLRIVLSRISTSKIASTPKGKGKPKAKKATTTRGAKKVEKELQNEEVETKPTKRATAPRGKAAGAKAQSKVKVAVKDLSYKKSPAAASPTRSTRQRK